MTSDLTSRAGAGMAVLGGGVAQVTSGSIQNAGLVGMVGGLLMAFVPLWFKELESRRQHDAKMLLLTEENRRMRERLDQLDVKSVQVDVNTVALAATKEKVDVTYRALQKAGYFRDDDDAGRDDIPRRVLVVEDDPATARGLVRLLGKYGFDVDHASTVPDTMDRLEGLVPFDWVILDLMLVGGNGEEILRSIRDRHLSTRVAVTTGVENEERITQVRAMGPDRFLLKPIDLQELIGVLRSSPTRPQIDRQAGIKGALALPKGVGDAGS
jgi:CheY-like chemotaxis protein